MNQQISGFTGVIEMHVHARKRHNLFYHDLKNNGIKLRDF